MIFATPLLALETVQFDVAGGNEALREDLVAASLVQSAKTDGRTDPRDVMAVANADYAQLLGVLYKFGYYGGRISILVDGREAGLISPFQEPTRIDNIVIRVDPGAPFRFGAVALRPLAPGSTPTPGFATGHPAAARLVGKATRAGIDGWRDVGHAKAQIADQSIVADHRTHELDVDIRLDPGPRLRFGNLRQTTDSAVRPGRLRQIAGLPTGEVFSPDELETAEKRLRRTGAFRSVTLSEAETIRDGDVLDIDMAVTDEKPRRFGFGAEMSTNEGLKLSGFWLHRNLFKGAERLRVDAEIAGLGSQSGGRHGGVDYLLGARLDRPATFGPDTTFYALGRAERLDEPNYMSDQAVLEFGLTRIISDKLSVEGGIGLRYSREITATTANTFTHLVLPFKATWDTRDVALDPTDGFYLNGELTPFIDLDGSATGARIFFDERSYHALDQSNKFIFAQRLQFGSVVGSKLTNTPQDFLFYSGGGGTVRGQPYQSLGVAQPGNTLIGGRSFLSASAEIRAAMTDKIGLVAFMDAGFVGPDSLSQSGGNWHSGAGLGVRYETGIGPVRLDVAAPVSGSTGDGVQFYVGIGQAF